MQLTKKQENSDNISWNKIFFFKYSYDYPLALTYIDVICYRTDSVEMQKPQSVNPELTCWPVTGILDTLNSFRGEGQPCGDQDCIS